MALSYQFSLQLHLQRFRVHSRLIGPRQLQRLLVEKHSVHQQLLPAQSDVSHVELVLGQRLPVLHRRHRAFDFLNQVCAILGSVYISAQLEWKSRKNLKTNSMLRKSFEI